MASPAFWRTECQHSSHSRCESREGMHNEREKEGERKAIDHTIVPFILSFQLSQLVVGKSRASAKTSMFVALRGTGFIPLAVSASMREYRHGADFGEVKFHLI